MSLLRQQCIDMLKDLARALQGVPSKGYPRRECQIVVEDTCDAGAVPTSSYELDAADLAFLLAAVEGMPQSKSEVRRKIIMATQKRKIVVKRHHDAGGR